MTSIKRIASHCLFANLQITIQPSRLCAYERSNYSKAMSEAFFWWFLLGRRQENNNITIVFFHKDFTFIKCNLQVDFAPLNAEIRQRQWRKPFLVVSTWEKAREYQHYNFILSLRCIKCIASPLVHPQILLNFLLSVLRFSQHKETFIAIKPSTPHLLPPCQLSGFSFPNFFKRLGIHQE